MNNKYNICFKIDSNIQFSKAWKDSVHTTYKINRMQ